MQKTRNKIPFYIQRIAQELEQRQRKNPSYSLRAFARSLQIQPPTLSAVLKQKRHLPIAEVEKLAKGLALPPMEKDRFIKSLMVAKGQESAGLSDTVNKPVVLNEEHCFRVIAEWEHYAILTLCEVEDFKSDAQWIGRRLGLPRKRVETCIDNLIAANLIKVENGVYSKCQEYVNTTDDVASVALRQGHLENIELAQAKLDSIPVAYRNYSSMTMAMDQKKLPEVKKMIRKFQENLSKFVQGDQQREVFQLNLQLFPLTEFSELMRD